LQTYGKIIITERYLPHHRKTIKNAQQMGGVAGGAAIYSACDRADR
jgi:hypothetical protein